jgi:hypothetical protein
MAITTANLQALAAAWDVGTEFEPIVIDMLRISSFLRTAVTAKASHGIKHEYRFFKSLPLAVFREIGEGIVPQKIGPDKAQIDLKELVFDLYEDYQGILQYPGGKEGWLKDYYPIALMALTNAITQSSFYGNIPGFGYEKAFKGFHQYAKDLGQVVAQKGGSSGSRSSIFAVRWEKFDGASLRFNNTELLNVIDMTPNQPIPIVTDTTTNKQMNIFKWIFSSYFTLVIPSAKSVAAITQIDSSHLPTADDINDMLHAVRAETGNTVIYCNTVGEKAISKLKEGKLNMFAESADYNDYVSSWRGIPIYLEDALVATETNVLD